MKKIFVAIATTFALLVAIALVVYLIATGPHDLDQYPPAESSPYRLPWKTWGTHFCVQSNRAVVSHRDWEEYAYDFRMPVGTEVCAARAGKVIKVVIDHDGHGSNMPNNLIAIQHDDGTIGWYLHLKKDGAKVKVGDTVEQGQVIAESGHVGRSMMPHLHFHVTDGDRKHTLPVSFSNLGKDRGIPRMFKWYKALP